MSYEDFQKLLLKEMQAMVQPAILTTDQPVSALFTILPPVSFYVAFLKEPLLNNSIFKEDFMV